MNYRQQTNNNKKIQIRFALTGHIHQWQQMHSVEQLKQQILNEYKIQKTDQILITKSGHRVKQNLKFEDSKKFKHSFSEKCSDSKKMQQIPCIYLFNIHDLDLRHNRQYVDEELIVESKQVLQKSNETGKGMRQQVYELEPTNYTDEQKQRIQSYNHSLTQIMSSWRTNLHDMNTSVLTFKQICYCVEEYINRCQNQRKSIFSLVKALKDDNDDKVKTYQKSKNQLNQIMQDKNYDSNDNTNLLYTRRKLDSLERAIKKSRNKILAMKQDYRNHYGEMQRNLKEFDSYVGRNKTSLQIIFQKLKDSYFNLIEGIKELLQNKSQTKIALIFAQKAVIQKQFIKGNQSSKASILEIESIFHKLYNLYRKHQNTIRKQFTSFILIDQQQKHIESQLSQLKKQVKQLKQQSLINHQNNKITQTLQQKQQQEIIRRQEFNMKILGINQEIKQILREQERQRRQFMADVMSNNQKLRRQYLSNVNVPNIVIKYEQTTDNEVLEMLKEGAQRIKNIDYYRPMMGVQKVLKQLQVIKNCQVNVKKEDSMSSKVRNLKTIIQKSADIFNNVFLHKLKQNQKKYESKIKMLSVRSNTLQREIYDLRTKNQQLQQQLSTQKNNQHKQQQQLSKTNKKLQQQINQLTAQNKNLQQKLTNISSGCSQHICTIKQLEHKIQQRKQNQKQLQNKNKQLSDKLVEQLMMLESVVVELQDQKNKGEQYAQSINEYKNVIDNQSAQITRLQAEIANLKYTVDGKQSNKEKLNVCFYDDGIQKQQIKSDIQQEDNSNINIEQQTKIYQNKQKMDGEVELRSQIEYLKKQYDILKQENQTINDELMKIMMKDTEDVEIQTSIENQIVINQDSSEIKVTLKGKIQQGQSRIFIPYTNGKYIAVNSVEPSNGETNYITSNQLQSNEIPYILDLNCLPTKARQLLTQCSLVLVADIKKILPGSDKYYVEAHIKSAIGFQDDDLTVRDYAAYLT